MDALAELAYGPAARRALGPFVNQYQDWIADQKKVLPSLTPNRREMSEALFQRAGGAAKRIEDGIQVLDDKDVLFAFRMANRVMARAARRRFGPMQGKEEATVDVPTWRPFQIAFILMNLRGIVEPAARRPGGGRSAVLPDRRRQDGGLPRTGGVHPGLSSPANPGITLGRGQRAHAVYAAAC